MAALVATSLSMVSACGDPDTVVLVRVVGSASGSIAQLSVTVAAEGEMRTFSVPEDKRAIVLPTSFTLQIPPGRGSAVTIGVRALDAAGNVVADGSLTASDLDISKQNVVTIQISPVTVGLPDGGGPRDANVNEPDASPISDGMGALDANGPMGFDGGVDVGAPLDAAPLPDAAERLDAAAPDAAPDAEADADVM